MNRLALKVDVDTLRGTLEGVPPLVSMLRRHGVNATFLFSLGPDNTGRALRRIFRRGFLAKALRTSVGANYGLKTLSYGVLWPGPQIGRRAEGVLRAVRDAGFEVGVHCHDHVLWQDKVVNRDEAWTRRQMALAVDEFQRIFAAAPRIHGAAGWQVNEFVPELEAAFGFELASDTRGASPFLPRSTRGKPVCLQLPTTLPTLDEMIGLDGCTEANAADRILALTRQQAGRDQVFTLHAEIEGMRLAPAFDALLHGWTRAGVQPCSLGDLARTLDRQKLPIQPILQGEIPGRSGRLACQGQ
jgi:peptidoglycan/xylan/chitin deacetylase (PgdA/CDA1 family)